MFVVSANFRRTSWQTLARVADSLPALESRLADVHYVSLSTCNRVELYVNSGCTSAARVLESMTDVCSMHGKAAESLRSELMVLDGVDAIEHLIRTTCGLEAIAVGEDEVGGQVRRAYSDAIKHRRVTPELRRVFDHALKVNRDLRKIDELPHNDLVSLALDGVRSDMTSVLVIGTGLYAREVHQILHARGVSNHWNYSTSGRRVALPFSSYKVTPSTLLDALTKVELVIGATGAAEPVVTAEHVRILQRTGHAVPMLIDLTLTEDIAQDVSLLAPVTRLSDIAAAHQVSAPVQAASYVRTQSQLLHHRMTVAS